MRKMVPNSLGRRTLTRGDGFQGDGPRLVGGRPLVVTSGPDSPRFHWFSCTGSVVTVSVFIADDILIFVLHREYTHFRWAHLNSIAPYRGRNYRTCSAIAPFATFSKNHHIRHEKFENVFMVISKYR